MEEICIRTAKLEDAKWLVEIYTPYVEETAITFEYDVQCTTYINYLQKLPNEVVLNVKTNY